jgi:uncharacterized repeat protein (TIGR03803 family)
VLYSFCSSANCADGQLLFGAFGRLVIDGSGNLYGTTNAGGKYGKGVVFEVSQTSSGGTEKVLYSFCASGGVCIDGASPKAGLIMDRAGNFYGTTSSGGVSGGAGTVFELARTKTAWKEAVLYNFDTCSSCLDGQNPQTGLTADAAGSLYGTTNSGTQFASGTVFQLSPTKTGWTETVLYAFCANGADINSLGACTAGSHPSSLIMDGTGNLYGTTQQGGWSYGKNGVVFEYGP